MNVKEDHKVSILIEKLKQGFNDTLLGVILFGSRARKEAISSSDYDIFIILDESLPVSPFKRHKIIMNKLKHTGIANFIIRTKEEFEKNFPALYLDLAIDGIVLYDKDNYTTSHLNRIKELIKKAGLVREKKSYGFNWYWKKPPKVYPWKIDWEGVDAVF